ncbi:gamma-glutamyltranspeptidase [Amylocystis lapponica]|nr:gamma-glutamyltranspeptidase [Amylocystis lapponica]
MRPARVVTRDSLRRLCVHSPHSSHKRQAPSGTGNPAYIIEATHGAVASENEACSILGVNVLKMGGNAVDAAVSTTLCIGIGYGGGGFMTVRIPPSSASASSQVYSIDFREVAPALANSTMYVGKPDAAAFGGLSAGVPGELRGLEEAHKRWGSLPWSTLVEPAAELARGWKVGKELGRRIQWFDDMMLEDPDWRAIFAPEGSLLKEGDIIRRTNLSHTLAAVAAGGADALYKGPIADAIVKKVRETGGIMTLEDLAKYRVNVAPSLRGSYRGKKIYSPHAPTSGGHYDDFVEEGRTVDTIFSNMTDDRTHSPDFYKPIYDIQIDHGTSHSAVLDKNVLGSRVMDPVTGIILNDEMDDFSTPGFPNRFGLYPSPFNYPEPGKRPLSSTVPIILEHEDGSFYLAIDWGMDISAAIEYGRLHDQLYPLQVDADSVYSTEVLDGLKAKGHNITVSDINRVAAVVQAVVKKGNRIYAASDSRKNGIAAGY